MSEAPERIWDFWPHDGGAPVVWREPCPFPAEDAEVFEYVRADRIEELEAKLAKATNALRELSSTEWVIDEPSAGWCPDHAQEYVDELEAFCNWAVEKSKGTLAELTGDSDV